MKTSRSHKEVILSVLSGSYVPSDVHGFVRLCYFLALPLIRKRVAQGRLDLHTLGLSQPDVVYDCIADLFVRDSLGHFTELERFFSKELGDVLRCSDELLLDTLRRIVFGHVNSNLIRLHSQMDPTFGKILHNLDVTIARTPYFEKFMRFGEPMLGCCEEDLLLERPTAPFEHVREELSRAILIHDPMSAVLKKLHGILVGQSEYQRTVPFLWVVKLLKEVYALGAEDTLEAEPPVSHRLETEDALRMVQAVRETLRRELHSYVAKKKLTEELFEHYLEATTEILVDSVSMGRDGERHFFQYLSAKMAGLSREEYIHRHKPILEYFVKVARRTLAEQLQRDQSAPFSL